jgi:hypothetical protein
MEDLIFAREENIKQIVKNNEILFDLFTNDKFEPVFQKSKEFTNYILKNIEADYKIIFYEPKKEAKCLFNSFAEKFLDLMQSNYLNKNLIVQILLEYGKLQSEEIFNEIYIVNSILKSLEYFKDKSIKNLLIFNSERNDELFNHIKIKNEFRLKDLNSDYMEDLILHENFVRQIIPIKDHYSYLFLPCNGYCLKLLGYFLKLLNSSNILTEEEYFNLNRAETYNILRRIFISYCIFSHNDNEMNYHPLLYQTRLCHVEFCEADDCTYAHGVNELTMLYRMTKFSNLVYTLQILKDGNYSEDLMLISGESSSTINPFPRELYKTIPCRHGKECKDKRECFYFHFDLEKRRNPNIYKIVNNMPCSKVYVNGKWDDVKLCDNKENCQYFHTKNELFYDRRNIKRVYNCPNEDNCGNEYCPYKHFEDIEYNELNIPDCEKVKFIRLKGIEAALDKEISLFRDILDNYSN